jgi:hypothetical protein
MVSAQKQISKQLFAKAKSFVTTRALKRRIQLKELSKQKQYLLKNFITKQITTSAKTVNSYNEFISKADDLHKYLNLSKLKFNRSHKNVSKRSKVLRELTSYHYHYKNIYRKHKYVIAPKLKVLWSKLINNSQYYIDGKLLPLAASKLYNLGKHDKKNHKFFTNFNSNNYKIDLSKYNMIKLQFRSNINKNSVVNLDFYFNPVLANNLSFYQWFSIVKDNNGQSSILKIVNPHSNQTHYINTLNVSCVYLRLINLSLVKDTVKIANVYRTLTSNYTLAQAKKRFDKIDKSNNKTAQSFMKFKLLNYIDKIDLLPFERKYLRSKKRRAAYYEHLYGRKSKFKTRKHRKNKYPLIVVTRSLRIKNFIERRSKVNYIFSKSIINAPRSYDLFMQNIRWNFNKGAKIKPVKRKKSLKLNPFASKQYHFALKRKRNLLKSVLRNNKLFFKKSAHFKSKQKTSRRTKLFIKRKRNVKSIVRNLANPIKLFVGKTLLRINNKKIKSTLKRTYVIPVNLLNLWNHQYINIYEKSSTNHNNKSKIAYNDFKAGKFPLKRSTDPVFKNGKLLSTNKLVANAYNQFIHAQNKLKSKNRLLSYYNNRDTIINKDDVKKYLLKWDYGVSNKYSKLRLKLIKRAFANKLIKSKCKLFKSPSQYGTLAMNKLNWLNRGDDLLRNYKNRHGYEVKLSHYIEFKSFRWKYYIKRWYSKISRWKRLAIFRRLMRTAWRNYRKINKNFIFIKLFRANFSHIMGISETELLNKWISVRRGNNVNSAQPVVSRFNQALQLKMDGMAMFLGLAPNRPLAQEFVKFGGMRVNGVVITDVNYSITVNDMLQIDLKINQHIRALHKNKHWEAVRTRVQFSRFLQSTWPLMLFMMVRYPHDYELLEESILNERWVRFFIRYFPVRIAKYKKAKVKWYKY